MDHLTSPCLLVSGRTVLVFGTASALRCALGFTTEKAIRDGFYRQALIVDAEGTVFRFGEVQLRGRFRFAQWMRQGRELEKCELVASGNMSLEGVKLEVRRALGDNLGEEAVRALEAARDLSELCSWVKSAGAD